MRVTKLRPGLWDTLSEFYNTSLEEIEEWQDRNAVLLNEAARRHMLHRYFINVADVYMPL